MDRKPTVADAQYEKPQGYHSQPAMTPGLTINDLTFQAATVNGSGSQSANLVLTRAIFSMGIPVAPQNVFPSTIEGLPTWYQLRVSPRGYQSRKGDPDVLVALNPATWAA